MTFERKRQLEEIGFDVQIIWECQVEEMLNENIEMETFFHENIHVTGPLIPRDGFLVKILILIKNKKFLGGKDWTNCDEM